MACTIGRLLGVLLLALCLAFTLATAASAQEPCGTPTPTPDPPTTVKNGGGVPLTYSPPLMTSPTTIVANDQTIAARGGSHRWVLDNTRDYIFEVGRITSRGPDPNTGRPGIVVSGGRNVWLKGGHITVPMTNQPGFHRQNDANGVPYYFRRLALAFHSVQGNIFVEGTLVDGPDLSEGILVQSHRGQYATFQNMRIDYVHARDTVGQSDNHPDVIQTLGVGHLRMDRVWGSTDSSFSFMSSNDGPISQYTWKRIHMVEIQNPPNNNVPVWQRYTSTWPMSMSDVYFTRPFGKSTNATITNIGHPVNFNSMTGVATWPTDSRLTGGMTDAVISPPPANLVPDSSQIGLGYVSPGYL
jgi:hypothetical protein